MRNDLLISMLMTVAALASVPAGAEILDKEAIPGAILSDIYKKHPNAFDITARQKKHFGQELYEVYFKEGEEKLIELYRAKGAFFVNGSLIDAGGNVPAAAYDNLKAAFGAYEIKQAILVVNPNGPGEEYDFTVHSGGGEWSVSIDGEGNIIGKEPR